MSQPTNLWWAYDSETGSFSALPASPFLVPALIIMSIIALFKGANRQPVTTIEELAGPLRDTAEWQQKYKRYHELIKKRVESANNFDPYESLELEHLHRYMFNPHGFHNDHTTL